MHAVTAYKTCKIEAGVSLEGGTGPGQPARDHGPRAAAARPLEEVPPERAACLEPASRGTSKGRGMRRRGWWSGGHLRPAVAEAEQRGALTLGKLRRRCCWARGRARSRCAWPSCSARAGRSWCAARPWTTCGAWARAPSETPSRRPSLASTCPEAHLAEWRVNKLRTAEPEAEVSIADTFHGQIADEPPRLHGLLTARS